MSARRRLRILFFAGGPGFYTRQYASLVSELAARGHDLTLAFQAAKGDLPAAAKEDSPARVAFCFAPERSRSDGWRSIAWMVRALGDLARYTHPRYERAPLLRRRMASKVIGHLVKSTEFEPLGRRLALRVARRLAAATDAGLSDRVVRVTARLEDAIPPSRLVDQFIARHSPDVVLATPVVNRASTQIDYLKSARRLGVPAATCVASWDNLTNKGLLRFAPERIFVWNEIQRREAVELHRMPPDRVVVTGAQLFDQWFERRPSTSGADFAAKVGLDPERPYVLYTCSNPAMTDEPEIAFVLDWVEALRGSADESLLRLGVLVRPHPNEPGLWSGVDLARFGNAVVWPHEGASPVTADARADFFDSLAHSAAVVGINTTAMIEAAIVGKSVLTVLAPEFAQESTLHFDYLLERNGGFLHVAASLDEHLGQLEGVLHGDAKDAERRLRFVQAFVRPHGLDRPATPILADAVEELANVSVQRSSRSASSVALRPLLALEAGLCSLSARANREAPAECRGSRVLRALLRSS
jgi:hypothetical protein